MSKSVRPEEKHNKFLGKVKRLIVCLERLPDKPYGYEEDIYNLYEMFERYQEHLIARDAFTDRPLNVRRHQLAVSRRSGEA